MRIHIVAYGMSPFGFRWAKEFVAKGHEVKILSTTKIE